MINDEASERRTNRAAKAATLTDTTATTTTTDHHDDIDHPKVSDGELEDRSKLRRCKPTTSTAPTSTSTKITTMATDTDDRTNIGGDIDHPKVSDDELEDRSKMRRCKPTTSTASTAKVPKSPP